MEHIEEDVLVFQNFYKSLKNNGILLISTPSDKGGSDVHDDHGESFIDEHVRDGYSIKDITEKLILCRIQILLKQVIPMENQEIFHGGFQ